MRVATQRKAKNPAHADISTVHAEVDVFAGAREELETLFRQLTEAGALSHVSLGAMITEGVRRVGTRTYQGQFDALFAKEQEEVKLWARPAGSEVRVRTRQLETEHGRMRIRRHGLQLAGETQARFPLDEELSLPAELYALSMREQVARAAVEASFDRSVERVDDATSGHVPKRQAEQEVVRAAADFEAFYATRTPPANDSLSSKGLQVMSSDGKGVTMRPEALRDATRKEAEEAKRSAVRGDPMAPRKLRRSDKRMAVVTAVWEQEPHKRSAQDVITRLKRDPKGRNCQPRSAKAPRPRTSASRRASPRVMPKVLPRCSMKRNGATQTARARTSFSPMAMKSNSPMSKPRRTAGE